MKCGKWPTLFFAEVYPYQNVQIDEKLWNIIKPTTGWHPSLHDLLKITKSFLFVRYCQSQLNFGLIVNSKGHLKTNNYFYFYTKINIMISKILLIPQPYNDTCSGSFVPEFVSTFRTSHLLNNSIWWQWERLQIRSESNNLKRPHLACRQLASFKFLFAQFRVCQFVTKVSPGLIKYLKSTRWTQS